MKTWHETELQYDSLYVNMVLRRARKIEAFADFIGFRFQLSYGIWNLFQNHEARNYLISQYGNLACIPTFHTTALFFLHFTETENLNFKTLENGDGKSLCDFLLNSLK